MCVDIALGEPGCACELLPSYLISVSRLLITAFASTLGVECVWGLPRSQDGSE